MYKPLGRSIQRHQNYISSGFPQNSLYVRTRRSHAAPHDPVQYLGDYLSYRARLRARRGLGFYYHWRSPFSASCAIRSRAATRQRGSGIRCIRLRSPRCRLAERILECTRAISSYVCWEPELCSRSNFSYAWAENVNLSSLFDFRDYS